MPIPQPVESPCGAMRQEGTGEHEEEQEEEEEEEEGGGGGGGSSLALEHLPDKLRIKVTNLVEVSCPLPLSILLTWVISFSLFRRSRRVRGRPQRRGHVHCMMSSC